MHSIRIRIMALTIVAILSSVIVLGTISIVSIRRKSASAAADTLRLTCDNCSSAIDSYLNGIEQSVDMVSRYAVEQLSSIELARGGVIGADGTLSEELRTVQEARQQESFDRYLSGYIADIEPVFHSIANRTNGVVTFYYRINPELSRKEQGFLYTRVGNDSFAKTSLTKLDRYSEDDVEHTGWYYIPIQRGRPSWIEPYDNKNLGLKMTSYVAPLYKAGTFLGVIGMDIGYDTLINQIRDIQIYDTGFAFLIKKDGTIIYHPVLESGSNSVLPGSALERGFSEVKGISRNTLPIIYDSEGEQRQLFFSELSSGMLLAVTAPEKEINQSGSLLTNYLLAVSLAILFIFSTITAIMMKRLTNPLRSLAEAAQELADGNYNVTLDYSEDNEIGVLTRSFQHLVEHLKIYISDLNSKAYRDAMTGVRNKGAFAIAARKLDDSIKVASPGEEPHFAFIMFDCNNLKKINDTYGHEKGDEYLKQACRLICDTFPHSPVFRMGGDEFTVLLQDASFDQRRILLRSFDWATEAINRRASEPWELVHIAKGIAIFDPEKDKDSESVLKRADAEMYEDKKRSKSGRI
ncbi:MAG: diguanylate cyclase [Oscillospiraceae bacterium]|nr:diguanylate cyclase [Oscillospiraceae bacterium]